MEYVYQRVENVPEGFTAPPDRVKPWGTGHAVMSCRNAVDRPFTVINADDFYSRHSCKSIVLQPAMVRCDLPGGQARRETDLKRYDPFWTIPGEFVE